MLPWSTSVDSTAHRGAFATGCIELPSADRGVPTAGGIIFSLLIEENRPLAVLLCPTLTEASRHRVSLFSPGGWQRKRKIPVISLQAIDLPITYNKHVLRGYSKPLSAAFLGINLMKSMILIVKCLDEE